MKFWVCFTADVRAHGRRYIADCGFSTGGLFGKLARLAAPGRRSTRAICHCSRERQDFQFRSITFGGEATTFVTRPSAPNN